MYPQKNYCYNNFWAIVWGSKNVDFSDFIKQADTDGVTSPENLPFLLEAPSPHAILLVHGFTGSPLEMRPLAEFLHKDGVACLGVRLPGHGTSPHDLARKRWEDWFSTVENSYLWLARERRQVYVVGMSTGCLLLLALALKHQLAGMALCSPYLKVKHRLARHAGWLKHLRPFHPAPAAETEQSGYYKQRPVAGVHQISRLCRHIDPRLADISAPVLALNSEGDQTIDIDSGWSLYEKLGSPAKIHLRFGPETPHVLTDPASPQQETVFQLIRDFVTELQSLPEGSGEAPQPESGSHQSTPNYQ